MKLGDQIEFVSTNDVDIESLKIYANDLAGSYDWEKDKV
jgi:hypothetical protein